LLSLDIFITGRSVLHPLASASLLSLYRHPPFLGIGIPLSPHRPPRYRYPSHFGIVGIRRQYPSLVLGLLLPAAPQPLHPLASSHRSLSTTSITAIPIHQPTSSSKHTNIPCRTEHTSAIQRHQNQIGNFVGINPSPWGHLYSKAFWARELHFQAWPGSHDGCRLGLE
jgi:hypothetical protein